MATLMKRIGCELFIKRTIHLCLPICQPASSGLKDVLAKRVVEERKEVSQFRKTYGNSKVGEITVDMIYDGMRGVGGLVNNTSMVHPRGVMVRGKTIYELRKLLPKVAGGRQPLPEGIFWLLLTGDVPTSDQVRSLSQELEAKSELPRHVVLMLNQMPAIADPVAQLMSVVAAMDNESVFVKAYNKGIGKSQLWEYAFDDAIDLIAKLPKAAAILYWKMSRNSCVTLPGALDTDWAGSFAKNLGCSSEEAAEFLRLYMTMHCEHDGGDLPIHTSHLVGSAWSNPYLAYSASLAALSGPLCGQKSQDVLVWLGKLVKTHGLSPSDTQLIDFAKQSLTHMDAIPGYGHPILTKTDPRFTALQEFASLNLPNDPLFNIVDRLSRILPPVLQESEQLQNAWPTVEAIDGLLLQHYGVTDPRFHVIMSAVSRSLGILASLIWDRAHGFPIERPKSLTTSALMELVR